ncbi:Osmotin, thaumatin-like protein [Tothia fuscella]|uniref:Osmotin, thaumatin-like protein n=1 Tax=Tothia fuscella TaxID=1048955 RepID=A0A9P4NHG1_9PEZI|nr:Osmotin, thaumatin-like protein [Tothia fuscella]
MKNYQFIPLLITNRCSDTIWPAISTQNGTGPKSTGFELKAGISQNLTVDTNWNGRVWGRTNCTFDTKGVGSCRTGDCAGHLECSATGAAATLAEFNLPAYKDKSFYDISLVDGYNLPLAIRAIFDTSDPTKIWPKANESNPSCVGGVQGLAPIGFNPYANNKQQFLGTSSSDPLPFDNKTSTKDISSWCPSDLLIKSAQEGKNNPQFKPCLSACSKTGSKYFCCTQDYNTPKKCGSNYYSRAAKKVCPDAYSFAYDDDTSTFSVPTGAGFEVIFCPGGRSTLSPTTT